jgi:hypothetical protein
VTAVEVVGAIHYVNDRRWYVGASFLWTSPGDGREADFGAMLHVTPRVMGAQVDLYDLLAGPPDALVEAVASAALGQDPGGG